MSVCMFRVDSETVRTTLMELNLLKQFQISPGPITFGSGWINHFFWYLNIR